MPTLHSLTASIQFAHKLSDAALFAALSPVASHFHWSMDQVLANDIGEGNSISIQRDQQGLITGFDLLTRVFAAHNFRARLRDFVDQLSKVAKPGLMELNDHSTLEEGEAGSCEQIAYGTSGLPHASMQQGALSAAQDLLREAGIVGYVLLFAGDSPELPDLPTKPAYGCANGFTSDDFIKIAAPSPDGTEHFPDPYVERVGSLDMTSIVKYDVPDGVAEWEWVQAHASFSHRYNYKPGGVWEFVLNLENSFHDIPQTLLPVLAEAYRKQLSYLIVHQGT